MSRLSPTSDKLHIATNMRLNLTLVEKSDNWKLKLLVLFRQMKLLSPEKCSFSLVLLAFLKVSLSLILLSLLAFGLPVLFTVCYFSVPSNSTRVSEVGSLCVRSHSISCSIEWGKTHKHIDLTVGEWVALCT